MIKFSSSLLKINLLRCFNQSLQSGIFDESWTHTIFQMLPKSGDTSDISNWRPIAILPILYKIFSRLVYNRISPILFSYQSWDQHAYTPDFRIEDALLCAESIIADSLEFNVPAWLLSMDLKKTFDSVNHQFLFRALGYHGLQPQYIHLLQLLYRNQSGSVGSSRHFQILRGVRQGDVLSAIIFNCVIDVAFEDWKTQLRDEGILVEDRDERLTNTRYADDTSWCVSKLPCSCRSPEFRQFFV